MSARRWLTLFLFSLSGCTNFFDYPEEAAERGARPCSDGIDNDADGRFDCDDTDCDGFCPELDLAACSDGRDNDGDGLTDAADVRCWPHSPPAAKRCAGTEGVEIMDHFDVPWTFESDIGELQTYTSIWTNWGTKPATTSAEPSGDPIVTSRPRTQTERGDRLVAFESNATGSRLSGTGLGALVRQPPFSGSLEELRLAVSARVPEGALLRAGVVPIDLAPSSEAPLPGAETALFSVTIDATQSPPLLALDIEGRHTETVFSEAAAREAAQTMGRLTVVVDGSDLVATFTGGAGDTVVRAPAPRSRSLEASRLVFWGGSKEGAPGAELDDLEMNVRAELPCGIAVPQIPGASCALQHFRGFGHTVSLARSPQKGYCALVTVSHWDSADNRLSAPSGVTAWSSADGAVWAAEGQVPEAESGAVILGAGIAADAGGLHAAVLYRGASGVSLGFLDGRGCDEWSRPLPGPTLFEDSEAPSLVIEAGQQIVYFTRPPSAGTQRTLWRVARDATARPPELVATLPEGVEAPVSLTAAGTRDLVLAHPTLSDAGGPAVALLVAGDDRSDWKRVSETPVLALPAGLDLPAGAGRLGFDDREVLGVAAAWDAEGGFLLYGARSTNGRQNADFATPILTVGTALLAGDESAFTDERRIPEETCGDGTCSTFEDCASCRADCPCEGAAILSDVFDAKDAWELRSVAPNPRSLQYFGSERPSLNWTGGLPAWSVLPLERALTGDFQLSFDVLTEYSDLMQGGNVYLGLGTAAAGSEQAAPDSGIFAVLTSCSWTMTVSPAAVVNGSMYSTAGASREACFGPRAQAMGAWQHVVLTRMGDTVSVTTPANGWQRETEGAALCGSASEGVAYRGTLPPLTALYVGNGDGEFGRLPTNGNPGSVTNVELRLLDDPERCPAPQRRCGGSGEQPICVNTANSGNHCGECGVRCGPLEVCRQGQCICGTLTCDGECVEPRSSVDHCGGCGRQCDSVCFHGECDPVMQGDCAAPFEVPAAGGSLRLVLEPAMEPAQLCEFPVIGALVGSFTPERSGVAVIDVDLAESGNLDSVLAFAPAAACGDWLICHDDLNPGIELGSHLEVPVVAGETYRIAVGAWEYSLLSRGKVVLHVRVE